jgi:riboflavin biosynthesis pyrimidine reductase
MPGGEETAGSSAKTIRPDLMTSATERVAVMLLTGSPRTTEKRHPMHPRMGRQRSGRDAGRDDVPLRDLRFAAALKQARAAAGDGDVDIAGGASVVRQALTANAIDELVLDVIPVVLGAGERLFTGVPDPGLEPVQVIHSPYATHIRYRLGRPAYYRS